MQLERWGVKAMAAAVVGVAALAASGAASARSNVYFSVGANVAPGVVIGASNAPVVVAPPVYVAPQPVYVAPAPVYYGPSYYYRPAPVYYAPPVYLRRPHGPGWYWRHGRWVR